MVTVDKSTLLNRFQWIIRGNIIVPTGNPFFIPNESSTVTTNEYNNDNQAQWLGPGLKLLVDHILTVDHNGIICHVQPYESFIVENNLDDNDMKIYKTIQLNLDTEFVCPGMIDLHIHAPQYAYTGTATDKPLMGKEGWLEMYTFPAEKRLNDDLVYAEHVYRSVVQATLRHGTTTAVYYATLHLDPCKVLVDTAYKYGQRALVGKVCMDRNSPIDYCHTIEQNIQETEELLQYIRSKSNNPTISTPLILPLVTPRFIPTCTPELLSELGRIALKYNCHITSHISESMDEVEFTQYLDQNVDNNTNSTTLRTDAMIFDSHNLLSDKCIMAHGVHINDADCDLLKERGTAIAHCPLSNFFFAGGILPCRQLMERQNRIGIGTDVAGGYNCSMLHSARMSVVASQALQQQQQQVHQQNNTNTKEQQSSAILDYRHAFYLATLGGAEALNMQDRIGSIQPGMEFDAIILSASIPNSPVQVFDSDTLSDIFQKLLVLGDDRNIKQVFVQGKDVTVL
jgi:guanine deaminase